jgi:hypothetical protein
MMTQAGAFRAVCAPVFQRRWGLNPEADTEALDVMHIAYALERHREACLAGLPLEQVEKIWLEALLEGPKRG